MKKRFLALPVSLIAVALQAQALPAAAQTAQAENDASAHAAGTSTPVAQATQLKTRLSKEINSKHAKVGDSLLARTTNAATLSNGMKLPRGTRLMGKVTEVQARSHAHPTSQLAFAFNQAVLKHGQTVPIRAVVTSVSVPSAMAAESAGGGMDASSAGGGMPAGGGMAAPAPSGGEGAGGAMGAAGGAVGGAGSVAENTAAQTGAMADSTVNRTSHVGASAGAIVNNGSSVSGPVAGLQGVTFSSSVHSNDSAQLHAKGENISLLSGTQMTMAVVAGNADASASGSAAGSGSMH